MLRRQNGKVIQLVLEMKVPKNQYRARTTSGKRSLFLTDSLRVNEVRDTYDSGLIAFRQLAVFNSFVTDSEIRARCLSDATEEEQARGPWHNGIEVRSAADIPSPKKAPQAPQWGRVHRRVHAISPDERSQIFTTGF
jgi:hypothetical protein